MNNKPKSRRNNEERDHAILLLLAAGASPGSVGRQYRRVASARQPDIPRGGLLPADWTL
jgi:hypothetical protein